MTTPASHSGKPVLLFLLHAFVLALLLGYWPSARALYAPVFRAQAQAIFAHGDLPALAVRPASGKYQDEKDTFVDALGGADEAPRWRLAISVVRLGYWPSAVLVALLLATPLTPRRRLLAVSVGLLWIDAFALGRLGLEILRAFAELAAGVTPGEEGPAGGALLAYRTASQVLNSNIVVIAAVMLGWAVVSSPRRTVDTGALLRLLGSARPRRPVP